MKITQKEKQRKSEMLFGPVYVQCSIECLSDYVVCSFFSPLNGHEVRKRITCNEVKELGNLYSYLSSGKFDDVLISKNGKSIVDMQKYSGYVLGKRSAVVRIALIRSHRGRKPHHMWIICKPSSFTSAYRVRTDVQ